MDTNLLISSRVETENFKNKNKLIDEVNDIIGDYENNFTLNEETTAENSQANKVLICDDCPFNIVAIKSLLQQFNFYADFCCNGKEALDMIEQRIEKGLPTYQLMMLDFSMPYIDGPTCCQQVKDLLRSKGYSKKDIPFICMLTAYQEKAFEDIAI